MSAAALILAALRAQGIDYQLNYAFNLDDVFQRNIGQFNFNISGTWLLERENQTFAACSCETLNEGMSKLEVDRSPKALKAVKIGLYREHPKWPDDLE